MSKDLISRQVAIDALIEWYGCEPNDIDAFKEIIYNKSSAQPEVTKEAVELYCRQRCLTVITNELFAEMKAKWSAQPEPKKGKWIYVERKEPQYDIAGVRTWAVVYKCSECGFLHTTIENFGIYDYCPNCGARMEGK